ncbi:3-deoxy-manno-octulosonate cytidylyltransferase [Benzoatithermus flavus]|uniref:3-deoxy-manno-octulosonate cytidylyltransferase n=1 Tax=Benzoatithermus flavus TaxID=3108223 RepID=A0ABU8XK89_9PROT
MVPPITGEGPDKSSRTIVLIPARLASTRLPQKPLLPIAGEPMIIHVWRRAMAARVGPVVVACAEPAIADAVRAAGGEAVLTDPALPSGTDRIFAALAALDPERRFERVVNLQGDLPTLEPAALRHALEPLDVLGTDMATLASPTEDPHEIADPNVVKAVIAFDAARPLLGRALYFTRASAPTGPGPIWHHIGIYAFRRDVLERFAALPPSPLEQRERLEQLRALENGISIGVRIVDVVPFGVDIPADLEKARRILENRA